MAMKLFDVVKDDRPNRVCVLCNNKIHPNNWYVAVHDFKGDVVSICPACARAESARLLKLTEEV